MERHRGKSVATLQNVFSGLLGTWQVGCAGQVLKVADNHGRFGDINDLCILGGLQVVSALLVLDGLTGGLVASAGETRLGSM